ncbi:uncharacterized protein LOC113565787 [Drosophila persimilis]|uniref:Single domain-containing protein n=1 Tax=Drosophila pseudoobscura pseudoobscura TaxID=46245 RepID=A0A0R3NU14_DROPS|nr:uncharacterized protein LOC26532421 [Drosophila pseudoobscura]XP_026844726.1 uncharacterized protein LOC113565787 [Drosophila persimilis]
MPQSTVCTVLVLMLMLHSICCTSLFNFQIFTDTAYPDKCVVDGANIRLIVDSGKTQRHPDRCALIECHQNGWALVYECTRNAPPTYCKYSEFKNPDAAYPECCEMDITCNDIAWE